MKTQQPASRLVITSSFLLLLLLSGCPANDIVLGTDGCQKDGKIYKVGEIVPADSCMSCVCQQDGTVGMCAGKCGADGGLDTGAGEKSEAVLNIDIANIIFGNFALGQTQAAAVVVTNTGTAPSGSLVVSPGANIMTNGCTGALAAKASCTLTITATSIVIGPFVSQVSISANPGTVAPIIITVTGNVTQPGQLAASPLALDFGAIQVGVPSPKQTITVVAMTALTNLSVSTSTAEVSIVENNCTAVTLTVGATCTIGVNFMALTSGAKSGTIVINAGGASGMSVTVSVTATVVNPVQLVTNPSALAFESLIGVSSAPKTIAVTNAGDVATGSLTASLTGVNATEFAMTNNTCMLLAPLATCTVSVVFMPTTNGPKSATLVITDAAASAATVSVPLSGINFL